jgi:hypothetical protein
LGVKRTYGHDEEHHERKDCSRIKSMGSHSASKGERIKIRDRL